MTIWIACLACWALLSLHATLDLGFSWLIPLSTGLTVGVLALVATGSDARGWRLFRLLAVLYTGIAVVNVQIEAAIFEVLPPADIVGATAVGLLTAVVVSAVLAGAFTSGRPAPETMPAPNLVDGLVLRLPAVAAGYVVLYIVAGMMIFPFVRDFYLSGAVAMPPLGLIAATQVVRGLVYALALVPLFQVLTGRRGRAALLAGLALSTLGGFAPLLMPVDDILPWAVRRVHIVEIGWSNFALGALAAWLLVRRGRPNAPAPAAATA